MDEDEGFSERISGIIDALVMRTAVLAATRLEKRFSPSEMDELRAIVQTGVKGAAIEGARRADLTRRTLIEQRHDRQTEPSWNRSVSDRENLKKTVKASPGGTF